MPSTSGTTQVGLFKLIGPVAITDANFDIFFSDLKALPPSRIGYGYVIVRQNASPNNRWVLWNGPIYAPGQYTKVNTDFGVSNFQYEVWADFNFAGSPWFLTI